MLGVVLATKKHRRHKKGFVCFWCFFVFFVAGAWWCGGVAEFFRRERHEELGGWVSCFRCVWWFDFAMG